MPHGDPPTNLISPGRSTLGATHTDVIRVEAGRCAKDEEAARRFDMAKTTPRVVGARRIRRSSPTESGSRFGDCGRDVAVPRIRDVSPRPEKSSLAVPESAFIDTLADDPSMSSGCPACTPGSIVRFSARCPGTFLTRVVDVLLRANRWRPSLSPSWLTRRDSTQPGASLRLFSVRKRTEVAGTNRQSFLILDLVLPLLSYPATFQLAGDLSGYGKNLDVERRPCFHPSVDRSISVARLQGACRISRSVSSPGLKAARAGHATRDRPDLAPASVAEEFSLKLTSIAWPCWTARYPETTGRRDFPALSEDGVIVFADWPATALRGPRIRSPIRLH